PLLLRLTCLRSPIDGCGGLTTSDPLAVLPFTVCALMMCETGPLPLLYVPVAGAVTLTVTTHVPPPAIVAPLNAIEPAPAAGVKVGDPQPVVVGFGVPATTIAPGTTGKVSPN